MSLFKLLFGQLDTPPVCIPADSPPSRKTKEHEVRPTVQKVADAIRSGTWETKWKQYDDFSLYGYVSFEAKPKDQEGSCPKASCLWHPKNSYYSGNLSGLPHGDRWAIEKTSIDLTEAEEKLIQEAFISLLPEDYQKGPEEVLQSQRLAEIEASL